MKGAPAWVTYVTCAVAVLALIVSMATYFRAGPRVRTRLSLSDEWLTGGNPTLTITVINNGLAAVDVIGIVLGFKFFFSLIHITEISDSFLSGKDLPARLEPGSQSKWSFKLAGPLSQGLREIKLLTAPRPADGSSSRKEYYTLIWRLLFSLPSGRRRLKLYPLRSFIRRALLPTFGTHMYGFVISIDLGNGVQKTTLPILRLSYWMGVHSKNTLVQEKKSELPSPGPPAPDPDKPQGPPAS